MLAGSLAPRASSSNKCALCLIACTSVLRASLHAHSASSACAYRSSVAKCHTSSGLEDKAVWLACSAARHRHATTSGVASFMRASTSGSMPWASGVHRAARFAAMTTCNVSTGRDRAAAAWSGNQPSKAGTTSDSFTLAAAVTPSHLRVRSRLHICCVLCAQSAGHESTGEFAARYSTASPLSGSHDRCGDQSSACHMWIAGLVPKLFVFVVSSSARTKPRSSPNVNSTRGTPLCIWPSSLSWCVL